MNFTYILEKYKGPSTKKACPKCGKKTFVRYVDDSGNYLHIDVGRCDRESKCGYHYKPKDYFSNNRIEPKRMPRRSRPKEKISYMDEKYLNISMKHFQDNNLFDFLSIEAWIFQKYRVGSANHWPRSTCFWYVDTDKRIRGGKIMLYDADTGKRVKDPGARITTVHSVLKLPNFSFKSCLWGEHLLSENPDYTVSIVESEKTAIVADAFLPNMLWLATGGKARDFKEMFKPLKGRNVILWPDKGEAYNSWKDKADNLPGYNITVSDFLEDKDLEDGADLADFFLQGISAKKQIDIYVSENPSYLDCCEALGIIPGEPLMLDNCPF